MWNTIFHANFWWFHHKPINNPMVLISMYVSTYASNWEKTKPQNWKNVSNTTDYNRLLKCWKNELNIGPSLVRERKTTRLIENTHTLYLFRTKFKLVSCVRQITLKFYGDDSIWQFFNFADKTGRVWVRSWICTKVDKVKLENQLRIVFWHAKLTWSNCLLL